MMRNIVKEGGREEPPDYTGLETSDPRGQLSLSTRQSSSGSRDDQTDHGADSPGSQQYAG